MSLYGSYAGFAQQVPGDDITIDEEPAFGVATADGTSDESYVGDDSSAGTSTLTGSGVDALLQRLRPDGDLDVAGWTSAPLYPKLADESDATVITGVLV